MTDISWTIHTQDYGELTLPGLIGSSVPTFNPGRSVELQFMADVDRVAFDTLREYTRFTNENTTNTGIDIRGKPWYYESPHPYADFCSSLVLIEPGSGLSDLQEWWAVITDASIQSNSVGTNRRITLELFILSDADEHKDREFIKNDFEAGL